MPIGIGGGGVGGRRGYVPGQTQPPSPYTPNPGPYRPPPSPYRPPTPPPTGAPPISAPPPPHNPYSPQPVSPPTGLQPISPLPGITQGPQPGHLHPISPIGRIGGGSAYNLPPPVAPQPPQFPIRQPMYLPPSARNAAPPVSIAPGTGPYGPVLGPTLIRR
jgi:hypothetical protein